MRVLVVCSVLLVLALTVVPTRPAAAQSAMRLISGSVPTTATIALLRVTRDAPPAEVDAALAVAGCEAVSLVVNEGAKV